MSAVIINKQLRRCLYAFVHSKVINLNGSTSSSSVTLEQRQPSNRFRIFFRCIRHPILEFSFCTHIKLATHKNNRLKGVEHQSVS